MTPSVIPAVGATFEVKLVGGAGTLGDYHSPCTLQAAADQASCAAACNGTGCGYSVTAPVPQALPYELRVRSVLLNTRGADTSVSWVFKRCQPTEFSRMRWVSLSHLIANGSSRCELVMS